MPDLSHAHLRASSPVVIGITNSLSHPIILPPNPYLLPVSDISRAWDGRYNRLLTRVAPVVSVGRERPCPPPSPATSDPFLRRRLLTLLSLRLAAAGFDDWDVAAFAGVWISLRIRSVTRYADARPGAGGLRRRR